jgi:DNA helicase-2/ATP-dependent DNA helicase PcrA
MALNHNNVMVVGDDAQSIYSFRGADFYNIMRFPDQFKGAKVIKLEENYRSTQPILNLTNAIISSAQDKFTKTLFTRAEGGSKPLVVPALNERSEARFIVDTIKKHQKEGIDLSEIAVLFRSGFHSYKLEMELTSHGFGFDKRGGLKLTESAHIKDVLSFFRVLVNPWDNLSWNRILLQIDKVGPKTAQKILSTIKNSDDPIEALSSFKPAPTWKTGYQQMLKLLHTTRQENLTPSGVFDLIMEYYEPIFEKIYYDDYPKRKKELDQIKTLIAGYGDLQSFIDDTALDPPDTSAAEALSITGDTDNRLILSTIHSAKGLEWDIVFVMGLAEGRFPHQNAVPGEQWEEERRLLYVAATRAKKQVYLTYPREMMTPDRKIRRTNMSPFLNEIQPGYYETILPEKPSSPSAFFSNQDSPEKTKTGKNKASSARLQFNPGMKVHHPFFGPGTIKDIPGPRRVEVSFDRYGDKILHLDYAQLEIME